MNAELEPKTLKVEEDGKYNILDLIKLIDNEKTSGLTKNKIRIRMMFAKLELADFILKEINNVEDQEGLTKLIKKINQTRYTLNQLYISAKENNLNVEI